MTAGAGGARPGGRRARLRVRVHPGARRQAVRGWHGEGVLKVEVTAPPEGGRANAAVEALIAAALGVKKSQVRVVQGMTSRSKTVEVSGFDERELEQHVRSIWPGGDRADA